MYVRTYMLPHVYIHIYRLRSVGELLSRVLARQLAATILISLLTWSAKLNESVEAKIAKNYK